MASHSIATAALHTSPSINQPRHSVPVRAASSITGGAAPVCLFAGGARSRVGALPDARVVTG